MVNSPPQGSTAAWCVPTAAANIMGFYRDRNNGLSIADNSAFPATTAWASNPSDWRDGTLDATMANVRTDLGYYMNTSNLGDPSAPIRQPMIGTHYGNIFYGLATYLNTFGLAGSTVNNYSKPGTGAAPYDTVGQVNTHTVQLSYARIQTEINAGRPLLLHLSYWNLRHRQGASQGGSESYDWAEWGSPVTQGPAGEVYVNDIGHTVTVVGYWNGSDPNNPFYQQGDNNSTPDAVVVYDNTDGTLNGVNGAAQLPLVLPYATGQQNQGLNVPWTMQTEITLAPEPVQTGLLGGGVLVLLALWWRRR